MTASKPRPDESTSLDSTAHLMNRISSQLASQLRLVSLDGRRRPTRPRWWSWPTAAATRAR
ncbi:hypothetical protein [Streptomyces sp. DI166]|uniref:hypothetical protein n=1 Tax=Streptomyces sp. DI166 TaxID=1839783 RepID=UPI0021001EB2|nr:hypothetical protein [Streptomyces sp. DI166]